LAGAQRLAAEYIGAGKAALENMKERLHPRAHDFLFSVAEYMINREY
jgi:hypothetical protein